MQPMSGHRLIEKQHAQQTLSHLQALGTGGLVAWCYPSIFLDLQHGVVYYTQKVVRKSINLFGPAVTLARAMVAQLFVLTLARTMAVQPDAARSTVSHCHHHALTRAAHRSRKYATLARAIVAQLFVRRCRSRDSCSDHGGAARRDAKNQRWVVAPATWSRTNVAHPELRKDGSQECTSSQDLQIPDRRRKKFRKFPSHDRRRLRRCLRLYHRAGKLNVPPAPPQVQCWLRGGVGWRTCEISSVQTPPLSQTPRTTSTQH